MRKCVLVLVVVSMCNFSWSRAQSQQTSASDPAKRVALIIVDMQNDFVREGAPMEVPDARKTIPSNQELLKACRAAGIPVIFTRFIGTSDSSLLWNWSPKIKPPYFACNRGYRRHYADVNKTLECIDVIDELRPRANEIVIDKYGYGAFHGTGLDSILKSMDIESIILTGTVTQICVEETGREAFHYGYKTTMVTDAVSSFMPDLHEAAIKNFAMKFGWTKSTREVIEEVRERVSSE